MKQEAMSSSDGSFDNLIIPIVKLRIAASTGSPHPRRIADAGNMSRMLNEARLEGCVSHFLGNLAQRFVACFRDSGEDEGDGCKSHKGINSENTTQ